MHQTKNSCKQSASSKPSREKQRSTRKRPLRRYFEPNCREYHRPSSVSYLIGMRHYLSYPIRDLTLGLPCPAGLQNQNKHSAAAGPIREAGKKRLFLFPHEFLWGVYIFLFFNIIGQIIVISCCFSSFNINAQCPLFLCYCIATDNFFRVHFLVYMDLLHEDWPASSFRRSWVFRLSLKKKEQSLKSSQNSPSYCA